MNINKRGLNGRVKENNNKTLNFVFGLNSYVYFHLLCGVTLIFPVVPCI